MKEIIIEGALINSIEELHKVFKEALGLPDYYGNNLDALWDMLTGEIDFPIRIIWRDYKITEKGPFTIVGVKRPFNSDTSYQEIPKFWDEWMAQGDSRPIRRGHGKVVGGVHIPFFSPIQQQCTNHTPPLVLLRPPRHLRRHAHHPSLLRNPRRRT